MTYTLEIDGEQVFAETILSETGWVAAVCLIGPQDYNGHVHAVNDIGQTWCFPNVVDSVTHKGVSPEAPEIGEQPFLLWFDDVR